MGTELCAYAETLQFQQNLLALTEDFMKTKSNLGIFCKINTQTTLHVIREMERKEG